MSSVAAGTSVVTGWLRRSSGMLIKEELRDGQSSVVVQVLLETLVGFSRRPPTGLVSNVILVDGPSRCVFDNRVNV